MGFNIPHLFKSSTEKQSMQNSFRYASFLQITGINFMCDWIWVVWSHIASLGFPATAVEWWCWHTTPHHTACNHTTFSLPLQHLLGLEGSLVLPSSSQTCHYFIYPNRLHVPGLVQTCLFFNVQDHLYWEAYNFIIKAEGNKKLEKSENVW